MNSNWMNKSRNRREALQSALGIGGLAAGGMMLGACTPASELQPAGPRRETVDFNDPAQNLRSFIKLKIGRAHV